MSDIKDKEPTAITYDITDADMALRFIRVLQGYSYNEIRTIVDAMEHGEINGNCYEPAYPELFDDVRKMTKLLEEPQ